MSHRLLILFLFLSLSCDRPKPKSPPPTTTTSSSLPLFTNISPSAGLTAISFCGGLTRDHLLESTGQGCAFIDYDNDGLLDIIVLSGHQLAEPPTRRSILKKGHITLYRNLGNRKFEDVTAKANIHDDSWSCGICAGDYDNDGHIDFYVTCFGPNRLYHNRGDGTFEQVAEKAGVANSSWGAGCSFFDADGDGFLDLYVANYVDATMEDVLTARRTTTYQDKLKVMAGPFGFRGARDKFFHNNGHGAFTDATKESGLEDTAEAYGLGVLTSDLDGDGDIDIYVANDSNPNYLYRNDGHGHFTEIGVWSGAGVNIEGKAQASMGVDSADFDGDGIPDIYITNFARDSDTFYRGRPGLYFDDITASLNLKPITYMPLSWGCSFLDYDNDGNLDLFICNGHIYPQVDAHPELGESYAQRNTLLHNENGKLVDATTIAGPDINEKRSHRGLAIGDFDNDGALDLLLTAIDSPPILLHARPPNPANHWLQLRLLDRHNRDAIGATVKLTAGGRVQSRELRSGSTYASQSALRLHFGLGPTTQIEKLEILWPSGQKSSHQNIAADKFQTLHQPPATSRPAEQP